MRFLVTPPRPLSDGILFSIAENDVERTVFLSSAAMAELAPTAIRPEHQVRAVMENMKPLVRSALSKSKDAPVAELIVLDPADVAGMGKRQ